MTEPVADGRVSGRCAPGFEALRDAFEDCVARTPDAGAGLALVIDGEELVELHGGWADRAAGARWQVDTRCPVFSCTKGWSTIVVLRLVDQGVLDLDAPVAAVWPAFAQGGKAAVTLREVLAHSAGLPALAEPVSIDDANDAEAMEALLAAQAPEWEPGSRHAYHSLTFGWLLGGIVRAATGRTIGSLWNELASRHAIDAWIGCPESVVDEVAKIVDTPSPMPVTVPPTAPAPPPSTSRADASARRARLAARSMRDRAGGNPPVLRRLSSLNRRDVLAAEWASVNGVASARALARVYDILSAGALIGPQLLDRATSVASPGEDDEVIGRSSRFGLGFMLPGGSLPVLTAGAYGHPGAGGGLGGSVRGRRLGFGFVPSQVPPGGYALDAAARLFDIACSCL